MGKSFDATFRFPSNFNVETTKPLDNRVVVDSISDLTNPTSLGFCYVGMIVAVKGSDKLYICTELNSDEKTGKTWKEIAHNKADNFTVDGKTIKMTENRELQVVVDNSLYVVCSDGLPEDGPLDANKNKIHLVPGESVDENGNNTYDEYLYVDGEWELFGSIKSNVDISDYVDKDTFNDSISAIEDKVDNLNGVTLRVGSVSEGDASASITGDSPNFILNLTIPKGSQGVQGVIGVQGVQGTIGIQGTIGVQGIQGTIGLQGVQGEVGQTGQRGETGETGAKGEQGEQGVQGSIGEKGDRGETGVQGVQGTIGETGVQGVQGTIGIQGVQGTIGIQGVQGTIGDRGETGVQGVQGTIGAQGTVGVQGVQGSIGDKGETGVQGVQGTLGIQGVQGTIGETGPQGEVGTGITVKVSEEECTNVGDAYIGTDGHIYIKNETDFTDGGEIKGPQGTQGVIGTQGEQGEQGVQGSVGDKGDKGDKGEIGFQGYQGEIGKQGLQGVIGEQGVQGTIGVIGLQGYQGSIGNQGVQGTIGVQGTQGSIGVIGLQGYQGNQGTQGSIGVIGLQGYQGSIGNQGVQGTIGVIGFQGYQGSIGNQGVQGTIGEIGFQGYQGEKGVQGSVGEKGETGKDGTGISVKGSESECISVGDAYIDQETGNIMIKNGEGGFTNGGQVKGPQGSIGVQGPDGAIGFQGYQGSVGSIGAIGNQGVQGSIGVIGLQGYQGEIGKQGTQGTIGVIGLQGYQGSIGNQGTQGTIGVIGLQGYQGEIGKQGVQGTIGAIGLQGYQGSVGEKGETGNQGTQGTIGVIGFQGYQGTQGSIGVIGLQGYQGSVGSVGPIGFQGYQGSVGSIGATGNQGVQGSIGVIGLQGYQGNVGLTGNQGTQGSVGATGNQGVQGSIGAIGFQGYQGTQGSIGSTGNQGVQGSVGSVGSTGNQGVQGSIGTMGFQGYQGSVGVIGLQGYQGSQGTIGVQGSVGVQGDQVNWYSNTGFYGATDTSMIVNSSDIPNIKVGDMFVYGGDANPTFQGNVYKVSSISSDRAIGGFQGNIRGRQGYQGSQGTIGTMGFQGYQGSVGATGNQGVQGSIGVIGFQGYQGRIGVQGARGETENLTQILSQYVQKSDEIITSMQDSIETIMKKMVVIEVDEADDGTYKISDDTNPQEILDLIYSMDNLNIFIKMKRGWEMVAFVAVNSYMKLTDANEGGSFLTVDTPEMLMNVYLDPEIESCSVDVVYREVIEPEDIRKDIKKLDDRISLLEVGLSDLRNVINGMIGNVELIDDSGSNIPVAYLVGGTKLPVNLNFKLTSDVYGLAPDADLSQYVKISYFDLKTFKDSEVNIFGNSGVLTYNTGDIMSFTISPVGSEYTIKSIKSENTNLAISEPSDELGDWYIACPEEDINSTYTIEIELKKQNYHVTVNFTSPTIHSSLVSNFISMETSRGEYTIKQATDNNVFYSYGESIYLNSLTIGGEEYQITGVTVSDGVHVIGPDEYDRYGCSVADEGDGMYKLTVDSRSNGLTFTVSVDVNSYPNNGTNIEFNFIPNGVGSPAYQYVNVVKDGVTYVNVDNDTYVYRVFNDGLIDFDFHPVSGYDVSVQCTQNGIAFGEITRDEVTMITKLSMNGSDIVSSSGIRIAVQVSKK